MLLLLTVLCTLLPFSMFSSVSRKAEHLYSALHGIQTTLKRSGMDHTAFNLQRTPCLPLLRKRSPDGASTEWTSNCSPLLIYQPRENERLSWPGWLTYSGRLTHISGHPSATAQAQDGERTLARDWPLSHADQLAVVSQSKSCYISQHWLNTDIICMYYGNLRLWDDRTEKDSANFMDSKENKWVGS